MAAYPPRRAEKQRATPGRYANVGTGTAIDNAEVARTAAFGLKYSVVLIAVHY